MNITLAIVLFITILVVILLLFASSAIKFLRDSLFFMQELNTKRELFYGIYCLIIAVFEMLFCVFMAIILFIILFFCI